MPHKFWSRFSQVLLFLTAWTLPWQTKLIVRPALSNYWEISFFVGIILSLLSILTLIPSGLVKLNYWRQLPIFWRWSALVLLLSAVASASISPDLTLSVYRCFLLLLSLVLFFSVSQCPSSWRRWLAIIFLLSLSLQALLGLSQFFTQTSFASSYLGIATHHAGEQGVSVIETANGRWLRAYGASDHPNAFGGLMAIAALASVYFFSRASNLWAQRGLLLTYILFFTAALSSFSRAAILALLVGLSIYILGNIVRKEVKRRYIFLVIFLSVVIACLFFWQYQDLLRSRAKINNRLEQISLDERQLFNERAEKDFISHPFLGVGLGASTLFDKEKDLAAQGAMPVWSYQPAHNYWLLAATESGIFFVSAWLLIWFFAYQKSRQARLLGLWMGLLILTLFDHWLFSLPLASFWFFFWLALI